MFRPSRYVIHRHQECLPLYPHPCCLHIHDLTLFVTARKSQCSNVTKRSKAPYPGRAMSSPSSVDCNLTPPVGAGTYMGNNVRCLSRLWNGCGILPMTTQSDMAPNSANALLSGSIGTHGVNARKAQGEWVQPLRTHSMWPIQVVSREATPCSLETLHMSGLANFGSLHI